MIDELHLVFLGFIPGLFDFILKIHLVAFGFILELRYYFDQGADIRYQHRIH